MKMNIKRIEINIKDDWRYGLVASLIDRADFLQDIEAIRKKHKIKKLFSREEIENETLKQFDETTNYFRKHGSIHPLLKVVHEYDNDIIKLQRKYKKSNNFQEVIRFSLICGEVIERDFENVYTIVVGVPKDKDQVFFPLNSPDVAIIITPETDPKEIISAYKNHLKWSRSNNSSAAASWFLYDVRRNIRRDREWFWLNKEKSYQRIAELENEKDNLITTKGVQKAIKRYERLITLKIDSKAASDSDAYIVY